MNAPLPFNRSQLETRQEPLAISLRAFVTPEQAKQKPKRKMRQFGTGGAGAGADGYGVHCGGCEA